MRYISGFELLLLNKYSVKKQIAFNILMKITNWHPAVKKELNFYCTLEDQIVY